MDNASTQKLAFCLKTIIMGKRWKRPKQKNIKPALNPVPQLKVLFSIFGTLADDDPKNIYGIKDVHGVVENRFQLEDGSIMTKLQGCSYLYKGYPDHRVMKALETPKDLLWMIADLFTGFKILIVLSGLLFIISRKLARKKLNKFLDTIFKLGHKPIAMWVPDEKHYCLAVKEVYRASNKAIDLLHKDVRESVGKIRDIITMSCEFDTVYRFPMQDIFGELNKENLNKSPRNEVKRLLDILLEREVPGDQRNKYIKIRKMLNIILLSPKARKMTLAFFNEIDVDKVKLDEADWYYCLQRHQYNYRGIGVQERVDEKHRIDKEKGHKFPVFTVVQKPVPHYVITN